MGITVSYLISYIFSKKTRPMLILIPHPVQRIFWVLLLALAAWTVPAAAQNFRIQICAFTDSVPQTYFTDRGVEGVTVEREGNLYKYALDGFRIREEAEYVREQLVARGFNNPVIIDLEAQRALSERQCGYQDGRNEPVFDESIANPVRAIYFEDRRTDLSAKGRNVLDLIFFQMKNDPDLLLRIMGFNDSKADAITSERLASERARNVRNYLINKGIRADRMVLEVYGEADPLLPNKDQEGNDLPNNQRWNRRVMLKYAEKK
jgi:outer membrane protein OmpA-like peptidoglycan-associated protein